MSKGAAETTQNKPFRENNSLIAMWITVVLFSRIHLRAFLRLSHFDSPSSFVSCEKKPSELESESNIICYFYSS